MASVFWSIGLAQAGDLKGIAVYVQEGGKAKTPDLQITEPGPEMEVTPRGTEVVYTAKVSARCVTPHVTLIWKDDVVLLKPSGDFELKVPIKTQATQLDLYVIDARGTLRKQEIGIFIAQWLKFKESAASRPPKTRFFTPGFGVSRISVNDNRLSTPFSELGLTAKATYASMLLPPHFDWGASVFFTVLPFAANQDDAARFLGINLRVGYLLPFVHEPWRVSLQTGLYYTTMFVRSASFGFQNMAGPQIFPTIRRLFKKGDSIGGYFKFSPVSADFGFTSLDSHEIATGLGYSWPLQSGRTLGVSVDLAAINLNLVDYGIVISSSSLTLGMTYGF
ncbi:hypothetical protein WDW37_08810 [Bdellovibrionota bacterium FG-1]